MSKIGWNTYLAYGEQTTFTTKVAPTKYVEFYNESVQKEIDEVLVDAINGTPQYKRRLKVMLILQVLLRCQWFRVQS